MEYQYTCHHLPETTPPSQRKPAPCAIAGNISSHSKTLVACSYHGLLVTLRPASTRPLEKFVLPKWPPNKCVNHLQYKGRFFSLGFTEASPPKKSLPMDFCKNARCQENHRAVIVDPDDLTNQDSGLQIIRWKPQPMDLKKSGKKKTKTSLSSTKKMFRWTCLFSLKHGITWPGWNACYLSNCCPLFWTALRPWKVIIFHVQPTCWVFSSRLLISVVLLMVQKSQDQPPGMYTTL